MKRFLLLTLTLLPLAACNGITTPTPPTANEQSSSRRETKNVIYRGHLVTLGASIYMEGTHRLVLEDDRFVLLESNGIILDDYLNQDVEVSGATRASVEGGAIIMRVERIAALASSSSSAPASSSVSSSVSSSSLSSLKSSLPLSSSSSLKSSSSLSPSKSSSPLESSSSSDPLAAKTAIMAKANLAAEFWTREYCAPSHIAFCFPVHKNWWYFSFGATSSSQWHVEVGPSEVQALGDGPLVVVLASGAATVPDGTVTVDGSTVVGIRTWTNGRHIEVRAPAALEAIVRYVTQELRAAPVTVQ